MDVRTAFSLTAEGHSQVGEAPPPWGVAEPYPATICYLPLVNPLGAGQSQRERETHLKGLGRTLRNWDGSVVLLLLFPPLTLKEQRTGRSSAGSANSVYDQCLAFLILAWNPQMLD